MSAGARTPIVPLRGFVHERVADALAGSTARASARDTLVAELDA
jgi:hypothetical protein